MKRIDYKWIALSNTTLGMLMAALDSTIVLIAMPAIFRGIDINPLQPGEIGYMLWLMLGFMVVTAVFLVTFGRISDMFGRVRLYNAGFAIFTLGSILLSLVHGTGNRAALDLILLRLVQALGAGFLFSNSTAILTDAFPPEERGMALGVNQIAYVGGSLIGLTLGGILAAIDWHLIFLVSVPVGLAGTVWAYLMLRERGTIRRGQHIDVVGNVTFAIGLTALLVGVTYALQPYGGAPMGWANPLVVGLLAGGGALLILFLWVETRVAEPMFRLDLFRVRPFWAGNLSVFLASLARGGLQFMLIIWLQGIWLPLHGYSFEQTPLWAGVCMIPLMVGFSVMGPISGHLSDRFGARGFSTAGMLMTAVAFAALMRLPADFSYPVFGAVLFFMGLGMGMFSAPNTASIMNAVPRQDRGAAAGMRSTVQNAASMFSMGIFFSIVIAGLATHLPAAMSAGLTAAGLPAALAQRLSTLPPTSAIFAAFLGYNPMATLIPPAALAALPAAARAAVVGTHFFPALISPAFMAGLHAAFEIAGAMALIAALTSLLRGNRYVMEAAAARDEPAAAAQPRRLRSGTARA